jgi:tRNA threonylcarbamoyladenosine biosynthesis protein TsaB
MHADTAKPGTGTLLAIDAAGHACVAAVARRGALLAQGVERMRRGQAERLVPLIESVLADARVAPGELDAVGVTTGPGGFTGVRIALATARGYALALDRPVVGASRFAVTGAAAAARAPDDDRPILVALDARRVEFCLQRCAPDGTPRDAPWMAEPEALAAQLPDAPWRIAGDAAAAAAEALAATHRAVAAVPDTAITDPAALVRVLTDAAAAGSGATPRPLYLRGADVTLPGGGATTA